MPGSYLVHISSSSPGSAVYHQARKSGSLGVVASGVWLPAKAAAPYQEP